MGKRGILAGIRKEGDEAYSSGKTPHGNPYPVGSRGRHSWNEGWEAARERELLAAAAREWPVG